MCPKDYVRYRLTGSSRIDVQEASGTLLLDVTHRRWSRRWPRPRYPRELGCPRSMNRRKSARRSPNRRRLSPALPQALPWWPARGDQGSGRRRHGHPATRRMSAPPSAPPAWSSRRRTNPTNDPRGRLHTFCHAVPGPLACHGSDPVRGPLAALVPRYLCGGNQL